MNRKHGVQSRAGRKVHVYGVCNVINFDSWPTQLTTHVRLATEIFIIRNESKEQLQPLKLKTPIDQHETT
eukprot:m.211882 g.211882  ORF g.211882 m.211882 type:complete len:70 (-) comp16942_c9_seq10:25-234(-)